MESREDLGGLKGGHIEEAARGLSPGKAASREARDDAEVAGASFEGAPESGFLDAEAVVMEPEARTTSWVRMLEQTRPKRGEKKERPLVYAFLSALEQRNGGAACGVSQGHDWQ